MSIPYGFVPERLRWAVRRGVDEAGQRIVYTSKGKGTYNPATGKVQATETQHHGRMALSQWTVGSDGVSRRKGTIEAYAFDPEMTVPPKRGDTVQALAEPTIMIVGEVTATVFRDVTVAYICQLEGGSRAE